MEDINDIAVLPSISPVGKVVKVVPEGLEFSPVRPQLQFLYDKAEIERLNVNPMELVIYFLTPEGRLEALNTVRQVIRVKYDEHDIPQGEEVLWDSAGDPFYDFTADYTYIKVWTELNHFSYYLVLEGMVLGMPEVTEYPEYTAQTAIKIKGTAVPDRELIGYVKEGAIFNGANPGAPGGFAYADARREYQFDAIALPFEGENYIFIGYSGKALSEFRKIKVIRDTRPPELIADISGKAFSPNGDGIKDTLTYDISSDEGGTLRWSLKDADNNTVYEKTRLVEKGEQIQVVLDGSGLEDKVLADGMYVYEMDITDSVGNCSDPVRQFIRLDRELEKPEVTIGEEKLSPRNNDGIYDTLEIAVAIPEDMTVQAFIGTAHTPFYVEILGAVECKEGNTIRLQWGGEDNYGQMVGDGDYYVRIRATDTAGNVRDVNYTEPVAVDNTASEIIGVNFYNGQVLFVPGLIEFKVQVTEETDIGFKISGKEGNKVVDREIKLLPGYNTIKWETNDTLADGEYVLGITGTDRAGNKSEDLNVALKITKDYDEPEIYGLQSDITAEAEGRTTNVDIGDPVILDRSLPVTVTNDSPGEFPLGTTRITWHAVDFYENRAEFIQNITVEDTTAPIIYEMPAEQINVTTANKYLTVDIGSLKAYDLFEVTVRNNSPGRFTHGKTNILWVAEDENGNSSTFSQKVEIVYPDNFSLPDGWFYGEIGDTPREGQSMYGVGQFISTGTGHGIAGMEDQGHYLYREVQGDFSFAAKLHEQSKVDAWTVGGLMIRETMKDDSKVFAALTDATRQIVRAARELERGNADQKVLDAGHSGDLWLLLERKGNQISTYLSADGEYWRQAGEPVSIVMEDSVLVGVLTATGDNRRNGRMVSSQFSFGRLEGADRTNGRGGGFRINRDQGDPKLTVLQGVDVFSPNNDGEKDSGEYKVISTRGGTIKWALRERENEGIAYRGSVNVNGNEETTVTITGMDSEGSVYRDGEYIVEMAVEDTVGNLSNPVFMEVRVDTIVERPEVTVAGEKEITIISGEPMTITGYIGIAGNNTLVKLFEAAEYGKDVKQTIHWDGRDNYGNRLKDDNYIISLEVTDKANNTGYYIYRETPVKVDTTAPIIRGVDFYNGDTMYMVPEPGFYFETNERCRATLTIMNSAGETVYSVTKHDVQGYAAMYWKLEEESREGEYTIRIDAWDDFGNKADPVILQGNLKRNGGE
jgi:regulation of enolase protein 1 (concanavalin A-like superfamily)